MATESEVELGSTPFRWNGLEEEYAEWKFEMEQWERRHEAEMPVLMAQFADNPSVVAAADMTLDTVVLRGKLMTDLAVKTAGKAKRLLIIGGASICTVMANSHPADVTQC